MFKELKPFPLIDYRLKDVSQDLEIPGYQLSAFLNQVHRKKFNEFINGCRV